MERVIEVKAREILDSRGDPTVEVELETEKHIKTIASVPSGASVGSYEAVELRDNDPQRFGGLGVLKAIEAIKSTLGAAVVGQDVTEQAAVDKMLVELDGTPHKSKLGANAILAVSLAVCKAGTQAQNLPLYKYIQKLSGVTELKMPRAMFNFIEGAKHADNNLKVQETMVVPVNDNFKECYRFASETFHKLKKLLKDRNLGVAVGAEGGFAPSLPSDEDSLRLIEESGQVKIAIDFAGIIPDNLPLEKYINEHPVVSVEDPAEEDDWEGWAKITATYGQKCLIVGDDIFASNTERLQEGVSKKVANAVIVKPNQIGTVMETIKFAKLAKSSNYKLVVSHRSGETEDPFIADFAVGLGADFVKFGAPSRGERVSKYNRLLRIEEELLR